MLENQRRGLQHNVSILSSSAEISSKNTTLIYIYSTKPKVVVVSDAFYETKLIGKKGFPVLLMKYFDNDDGFVTFG